MRIAVTFDTGRVFQHFGQTKCFKIYDVSGKSILREGVYGTQGAGHSQLAGILAASGVDVVICGGIGGGAMQALQSAGIQVVPGTGGDVDKVVKAWLNGEPLPPAPAESCHGGAGHGCHGHGGGAGHGCGHHGGGPGHGRPGGCGGHGGGFGGPGHGCGHHGCH